MAPSSWPSGCASTTRAAAERGAGKTPAILLAEERQRLRPLQAAIRATLALRFPVAGRPARHRRARRPVVHDAARGGGADRRAAPLSRSRRRSRRAATRRRTRAASGGAYAPSDPPPTRPNACRAAPAPRLRGRRRLDSGDTASPRQLALARARARGSRSASRDASARAALAAADAVVGEAGGAHLGRAPDVAAVEQHRLLHQRLQALERRAAELVPLGDQHQRVGALGAVVVGLLVLRCGRRAACARPPSPPGRCAHTVAPAASS